MMAVAGKRGCSLSFAGNRKVRAAPALQEVPDHDRKLMPQKL
jgi:hypothetical protein